MSVIRAADLWKSFGDRQALAGLSFAIPRGEIYGLVGPNGAGKTTTVNILCGLLAPDRGEVALDGRAVPAAARHEVGVATQEVALYADLTCEQNLRFFATLYGLAGAPRTQRVSEGLQMAALEDRAGTMASDLSGGQRRRLHVAIAMLHRPALLILDEPTAGLDLDSRHRMWQLVRARAAAGSAVLVTTHHLEEAEALCHRIGVLAGGRLLAEGTMDELRARIPAAAIAVIEAPNHDAVGARAAAQGLTHRRTPGAVSVWLQEQESIEQVAARFRDVPLHSVRLRPVGLEDILAELTGGGTDAAGRDAMDRAN